MVEHNRMKIFAARLLVMVGVVTWTLIPRGTQAGEDSDEGGELSDISDEVIIAAARSHSENLAAEFVPGLDTSDSKFAKKVETAEVAVLWRRPLSLSGEPALLTLLRSSVMTANAMTKCDLAAVLKKGKDGKPAVQSTHQFCSGGRTSTSLSAEVLEFSRGRPLLLSTMEQWLGKGGGDSYTLYRIDRGKFERVLSLSTFMPMGMHKTRAERCTRPQFQTVEMPGAAPKSSLIPGARSSGTVEPNAVVATWVCRNRKQTGITQMRSRIWTWQGGEYLEVTPEDVGDYPPQMGGPKGEQPD